MEILILSIFKIYILYFIIEKSLSNSFLDRIVLLIEIDIQTFSINSFRNI